MTNRREALLLLSAAAAAAQNTPASPLRVAGARDLPKMVTDNWRFEVVEITVPPGAQSPAHFHPNPGFVVGYVLEGSYRFAIDDQPAQVLTAGQMFYEPPGAKHSTSGNGSTTKPARILAIVFGDKSQPLSRPA
ncbi:MAG: cupin domain-containing protein [Acidobacteria bacterium]|nr:cupin domain-containing protein [Acidobacteriota bacterium]